MANPAKCDRGTNGCQQFVTTEVFSLPPIFIKFPLNITNSQCMDVMYVSIYFYSLIYQVEI